MCIRDSSYTDLIEGYRVAGERVAVIGAGGIGFDVAEFLTHVDDAGDDQDELQRFQGEWGIDPVSYTHLPKTGQPDFATLWLDYIPEKTCVELKSLKLYIWSFRNVGCFHEAVTNSILDDLVSATRRCV